MGFLNRERCFLTGLQAAAVVVCTVCSARAAGNPVLDSVFPPGGRAGTAVEVTIAGTALDGVSSLYCSCTGITCEKVEGQANTFALTIPAGTPVGQYDVCAVTRHGLSSPRVFVVGNRKEILENQADESQSDQPQVMPLDVTINGIIQKGDVDHYVFPARKGHRILLECSAERIDSNLHAMLEVLDSTGRRLAVNRGYFGIDPLIDFIPPADGSYTVRVYDLVYSGSRDHYYRLDIDTGPRAAFALPCVLQAGRINQVTVFGWNLDPEQPGQSGLLDQMTVEINVPAMQEASSAGLRLQSNQISTDCLAYRIPQGHAPLLLALTDVPVVVELPNHSAPAAAQEMRIPSEIGGQLADSSEQDWYAFSARRGEVLWLEAFGERIGSPVDMDLTVLDASGAVELVRFSDERFSLGGKQFPSSHSDPSGRFVVPDDGRYLVLVRTVTGGLDRDPRRVYRFSIRRQEPEIHLAVVPRSGASSGINLEQRGRTLLDVLAFRDRGLTGAIRVSATGLPVGVECPDIWIGPGTDRAAVVLSAADQIRPVIGTLRFEAHPDNGQARKASGGVVVRAGRAVGWSRLTDASVMSVAGEAQVRITATGHESRTHHLFGELHVRHAPGGILDVAVQVDRLDLGHQAAVKLTGVGVPALMDNPTTWIPAGETKGYLSIYLPS
ncbi:MAG: PPC domain-containing protein, partial [Planctomycetaceae bacterium]